MRKKKLRSYEKKERKKHFLNFCVVYETMSIVLLLQHHGGTSQNGQNVGRDVKRGEGEMGEGARKILENDFMTGY